MQLHMATRLISRASSWQVLTYARGADGDLLRNWRSVTVLEIVPGRHEEPWVHFRYQSDGEHGSCSVRRFLQVGQQNRPAVAIG